MPGDTAGGLLLTGLFVLPHDPVAAALRELGLAADAPPNAAAQSLRLVERAPAVPPPGAGGYEGAALLAALGRHADDGSALASAGVTGRVGSPGQAGAAGPAPGQELAPDELAGLLAFWDTFGPGARPQGGAGGPGSPLATTVSRPAGPEPTSSAPAAVSSPAAAPAHPGAAGSAAAAPVIPPAQVHPLRLPPRGKVQSAPLLFSAGQGSGGGSDLGWSGGSLILLWHTNLPANPSLTPPATQTNNEGDTVSVPVTFSDPNNCAVTFDAVGLPAGLSINPGTGVISGTIGYHAAEDFGGDYHPHVVAIDCLGGDALTSFAWAVNDTPRAPVLTGPGNQSDAAGQSVSLQLQATDPDGNPILYGATGLPEGLDVDPDTGLISGTIDPGAGSPTPYTVTLTANDGGGAPAASQTVNWTVTAANLAPQLTSPGSQTNAAGDSVSLALTATDADNDLLTYTASGLPAGLSIDPSSGTIAGTLASSAASATPYSVTVTASDGALSSAQTFAWTVNYVGLVNPGDQSNLDGDAVSLPLTADSAGGTLSYSATGLPPGLAIDAGSGTISGTVGTTADTGSPYTVTVTASDSTHPSNQTFAWSVARLSLDSPGDQVGREGVAVSLPVPATDNAGSPSYSATGLPPGLSINTSTGTISGTPAVGDATAGPYQVTVTATDSGSSASQSFPWTVAPRVTLLKPPSQTDATGDSVSVAVIAATVGGTLSYSATGLPSGLSINSTTGVISGTIASNAGSSTPYQVTVTAGDGTASSSQTFTWAVSTIAIPPPAAPNNQDGDTVSLSLAALYHGTGTLSYSSTGLPPGLAISSSTGLISGTLASTADTGSPYTVTVTATDGTAMTTQSFNWTVTPRIEFDPVDDQFNGVGDTVSVTVSATDDSGGTLSYSATGLPPGLTINSSTGAITGTIAVGADTNSPYTVTVTAADSAAGTSASFQWTVTHVALANPGTQVNADGTAVSLPLQGQDADGDTVTFSATGLPPGLSVNSSTGLISGTLANTADASSGYLVTVTATDGTNSTSQVFQWDVTHVGLVNPGSQTSTEGTSVSLPVTGSDPDGDTLTYSAGGLPPGLSINPATGLISGTLPAGSPEGYTVTVAATDGSAAFSQGFSWTVNAHVTLTTPADQTNTEGDTVSLQVQANDPDHDTLTYAATGLPAGLSLNTSTGLITGMVQTGDAANGPYGVTVSATDGTFSTAGSFSWTVNFATTPPPPVLANPGPQDNVTGQEAAVTVQASDPNGYPLTFSATGLPDGITIDPNSGTMTGTLQHDAASDAPYSVTVTADDGYGDTASQTFLWGVTDAPINAVAVGVSAVEGNDTGTITVATFTTADLTATADDYTATVTWGDGNQDSDATIAGSNGSFTITDDHTYTEIGTYPVTVAIADETGTVATPTATASVGDASLTMTGNFELGALTGQATLLTVADFSDGNPFAQNTDEYTFTVAWGDQSSGNAYLTAGTGDLFSVSGQHTYAQDGIYTVTVTASDEDGATAQTTDTIVVAPAYAGLPVTLTPSGVLDPDSTLPGSSYSATIAWGDNQYTTTPLIGSNGSYALPSSALQHTYAADSLGQPGGVYTVSITVTDPDGSNLSGTGTVRVARPPMLAAAAGVPNAVAGQPVTAEVQVFAEPDFYDTPSEFSDLVWWGDGSSSGAQVQAGPAPGLFELWGTHTYSSGGFYPVQVEPDQSWPGMFAALLDAAPDDTGRITGLQLSGNHFVLVNADDDNRTLTPPPRISRWAPDDSLANVQGVTQPPGVQILPPFQTGIPVKRDYQVSGPYKNPDLQLVPLTLTITGTNTPAAPGIIRLTIQQNASGGGTVRLWSDAKKTRPILARDYSVNEFETLVGTKLYVEGTQESQKRNDVQLSIAYLPQGNKVLIKRPFNITITPYVIDKIANNKKTEPGFGLTPSQTPVTFLGQGAVDPTDAWPGASGMGLAGIATFKATVVTNGGYQGRVWFIQDYLGATNNLPGGYGATTNLPGVWKSQSWNQLPTAKKLPQALLKNPLNGQAGPPPTVKLPWLDYALPGDLGYTPSVLVPMYNGAMSPRNYYPKLANGLQGVQITARDQPKLPLPNFIRVNGVPTIPFDEVDVTDNFITYVVYQFPDGTIRVEASLLWSVRFNGKPRGTNPALALKPVPGDALTQQNGPFIITHANPKRVVWNLNGNPVQPLNAIANVQWRAQMRWG
jgi:hypothetical protein